MPHLTQIDEMIEWAKAAGRFTRTSLINGNSNSYSGVPGTRSRVSDEGRRNAIASQVSHNYLERTFLPQGPLERTLCDAKLALGTKAGNCDQQASIAFAFLFQHDIYPIHRAELPGHCFVMIGQPPTFVICDPWADLYEEGSKFLEWARSIWGQAAPNFWSHEITTQSLGAGGSPEIYNRLTAGGPSLDGMDLTD